MLRKIIKIDENLCNGCGLCVHACHEGAIGLANGKAVLLREDYCDGLGDCLPTCPTGAIAFEEREAAAYDEQAVQAAKAASEVLPCGCPGTHAKAIQRAMPQPSTQAASANSVSALQQWPVQIQLVPPHASYFNGAHLLVAADCTAYAYSSFHRDFMRNKITLIGCPKLDEGDYSTKLTEILKHNNIRSVTVVRMEVPCCGGIENAVKRALQSCGKLLPWSVAVISTNGTIIEN